MSQQLLAIESSCDETSASVVRDGRVVSLVVSSQIEHRDWGGVVPEIASRAHLRLITPVVRKAVAEADTTLSQINAVGVTTEPGLIGSLLVGVNTAKGLALGLGVPLIAVHHIEAHLLSVLIDHDDIHFPFVGLVVSGGHTLVYDVADIGRYELLGATRDDAAGEAFDKGAKLLGLGYPGGPELDRLARDGDPTAHTFPRGLLADPGYDFSFSGLKTSLRYFLRDNYPDNPPAGQELADIAASYQEAIVEVLAVKTVRAARKLGRNAVAVVGGVGVNSRLREKMEEACRRSDLTLYQVRPIYNTDNAAMIGVAAWQKFKVGKFSPLTVTARAAMIRAGRP